MKPIRKHNEVACVAIFCLALTVAAAPPVPLPLAADGARAGDRRQATKRPPRRWPPIWSGSSARRSPCGDGGNGRRTQPWCGGRRAIPGLSARRAAMQGYRIHTADGRLHLTGRSAKGLAYAV